MLSARLRNLVLGTLGMALSALLGRGFRAGPVHIALTAAVERRHLRLAMLMDRFEAQTLRVRKALARTVDATGPRTIQPRKIKSGAPRVWPAKLWPWHVAGWLDLLGTNNPSAEPRVRWTTCSPSGARPEREMMQEFARGLRALVDETAMQGLLAVSREARRHMRWFLRMTTTAPLPEAVREPRRARRPRTGPRRPRGSAPPRPARMPGPFETPPPNLSREERVARGLPVPPPIVIHNFATLPIVPTHIQMMWKGERERRGGG